MSNHQSLSGFGAPELILLIYIGVVAAIIYAIIFAFRKGYFKNKK